MVEEGLWTDCPQLTTYVQRSSEGCGVPSRVDRSDGGWSSIGTIGSKYGQGYDLNAVREQLDAVKIS